MLWFTCFLCEGWEDLVVFTKDDFLLTVRLGILGRLVRVFILSTSLSLSLDLFYLLVLMSMSWILGTFFLRITIPSGCFDFDVFFYFD